MRKVLILEDEVSIRSFVVINLKRAGYDTIEAGTGEEALRHLRENPDIGVAILDIMLPDIDGFEVCRRIRANNKQIGIIMLTARTQEMDKITGLMIYMIMGMFTLCATARKWSTMPPSVALL